MGTVLIIWLTFIAYFLYKRLFTYLKKTGRTQSLCTLIAFTNFVIMRVILHLEYEQMQKKKKISTALILITIFSSLSW